MRLIHFHAEGDRPARPLFPAIVGTQPAGAVALPRDLTRDAARAMVEARLAANPMAWVVARGPAVAVFHRVAADRLSLRIAGAVLFEPADWTRADGRIALGLDPLPFPSVIVGDCAARESTVEFALAWGASLVSRVNRAGLLDTPAVRDMITRRQASLAPRAAAATAAFSPSP